MLYENVKVVIAPGTQVEYSLEARQVIVYEDPTCNGDCRVWEFGTDTPSYHKRGHYRIVDSIENLAE